MYNLHLPIEIWNEIFMYLNIQEQVIYRLVCKGFRDELDRIIRISNKFNKLDKILAKCLCENYSYSLNWLIKTQIYFEGKYFDVLKRMTRNAHHVHLMKYLLLYTNNVSMYDVCFCGNLNFVKLYVDYHVLSWDKKDIVCMFDIAIDCASSDIIQWMVLYFGITKSNIKHLKLLWDRHLYSLLRWYIEEFDIHIEDMNKSSIVKDYCKNHDLRKSYHTTNMINWLQRKYGDELIIYKFEKSDSEYLYTCASWWHDLISRHDYTKW